MKDSVKSWVTILIGAVLIAIITPLAQFSTLAMINTDMETAAASGWLFGILFSLVMVGAALKLITKKQILDRKQVVLLFVMLSIAVPLMNVGLVRPLVVSMRAVQQEFIQNGNDTYRIAYEALDTKWMPVTPTAEGLAYNKSDRLLNLLTDKKAVRGRERARDKILLNLQLAQKARARKLEEAENWQSDSEKLVPKLGADEARSLVQSIAEEEAVAALAAEIGLDVKIAEQAELAVNVSADALGSLQKELLSVDEQLLYFLPRYKTTFDITTVKRIAMDRDRYSPEELAELDRRAEEVRPSLDSLTSRVTSLSQGDRRVLHQTLTDDLYARYGEASAEQLASIRTSFMLRARTQERRRVSSQAGQGDQPNQNFLGMNNGAFRTNAQKLDARERDFSENLEIVRSQIPWELWVAPLLRWGLLVFALFLFMMCLAEWMRRKWVERENLAFPLVDVADNLLRHDYEMETAEDLTNPPPRKGLFHPFFWVGFILGALIIGLEVAGHYEKMNTRALMGWDLNKLLFSNNELLKNMDKLFFILSPVLIGLFFLLSLEISFSVWLIYLIYRLIVVFVNKGADISDPGYVGYAATKSFPFPMEQLLGISIFFTIMLLVKTWGADRKSRLAADPNQIYVPNRLVQIGLAGLPLLVALLLWDIGVTHVGAILAFFLVSIVITIAMARVRAETGLPMQHTNYEMTRLPMVLGLTGGMGARAFTSWLSIVFLPATLLFRLLPQQLENLELARRNKLKASTVAIASIIAFIVALVVGLSSFIQLVYWTGNEAFGGNAEKIGGMIPYEGVIQYPLWISHYFNVEGLDKFDRIHGVRIGFVLVGAAVFGALVWMRGRFLKFPLHPLGYMLVLGGTLYKFANPFGKGSEGLELGDSSWLWGSAFFAWLIKVLIIKYGGMNTYRRMKPAFVGLIVGALACMFFANVADLSKSIEATGKNGNPDSDNPFLTREPYTPHIY